jgi:hypothetical protein
MIVTKTVGKWKSEPQAELINWINKHCYLRSFFLQRRNTRAASRRCLLKVMFHLCYESDWERVRKWETEWAACMLDKFKLRYLCFLLLSPSDCRQCFSPLLVSQSHAVQTNHWFVSCCFNYERWLQSQRWFVLLGAVAMLSFGSWA